MVDYPIEILPQRTYIHKMDVDALCSSIRTAVVHRSNLSSEMTFNELGFLRDDVIPIGRVPCLSMNLLGGAFRPEDVKFRVTGDGMKEWDGSSEILLDEFMDFIKIIETDYCPIFFDTRAINNHNVPYDRDISQDKNFKKRLISNGLIDSSYEEKVVGITGETKILHSPNNLNYWHVELAILAQKGDDTILRDSKGSWKDSLCKQVVKDVLSINATPGIEEIETIPTSVYLCPPPTIHASPK